MKTFFGDDIFLTNEVAARLYDGVKNLPIYDYHCHLSPEEIYNDKVFYNITQLWLYGDHYKWRLMRMAGVDEYFITGAASDKEKFIAFARVLPDFCGNPVYHWAQTELKIYFGITTPISADTAEEIWQKTCEQMADGSFSAKQLILKSNVTHIVTTDEALSDLHFHKLLATEEHRFVVKPSFRCDLLVKVDKLSQTVTRLSQICGFEITNFEDFVNAITCRMRYFKTNGATTCDLSLDDFPAYATFQQGCNAFSNILSGNYSAADISAYRFNLLVSLGKINAANDWIMQLHMSVVRNNNGKMFENLGCDVGGDSIARTPTVGNLAKLLDVLNSENALPRMIVYTMNEYAYKQILTLLGCFAADIRGKLQLGAAWWFCDSRDGITRQLKELSANAGLGHFNGMLTDSRSFTSYARHDYFRRVLCSLVGEWVEQGEVPFEQAQRLLDQVCYRNALENFGK